MACPVWIKVVAVISRENYKIHPAQINGTVSVVLAAGQTEFLLLMQMKARPLGKNWA